MIEQAKSVTEHFATLPVRPTHLIRDRDGKFVPEFHAILEDQGIDIKPTAPRQPNQNAYAVRFVLSIKTECLDHLCVFGEAHLQHLLAEYEEYANHERPHQGLGNNLVSGETAQLVETASASKVVCSERLGGFLKHYHHQTA